MQVQACQGQFNCFWYREGGCVVSHYSVSLNNQ